MNQTELSRIADLPARAEAPNTIQSEMTSRTAQVHDARLRASLADVARAVTAASAVVDLAQPREPLPTGCAGPWSTRSACRQARSTR